MENLSKIIITFHHIINYIWIIQLLIYFYGRIKWLIEFLLVFEASNTLTRFLHDLRFISLFLNIVPQFSERSVKNTFLHILQASHLARLIGKYWLRTVLLMWHSVYLNGPTEYNEYFSKERYCVFHCAAKLGIVYFLLNLSWFYKSNKQFSNKQKAIHQV